MAQKKGKKFWGPTKRKVVLLLSAGLALGMTKSFRMQKRILKTVHKEWKEIDSHYLRTIINEFKYHRLVDYRELKDGTVTIVLTKKGEEYALRYKLDEITIFTPSRWDGRWRVVMFDIPEKYRLARDSLRDKLKEIGFCEVQKSVFVHPYPCRDEIDFIVEVFGIRKYVRFGELLTLTLEEELLQQYSLKPHTKPK